MNRLVSSNDLTRLAEKAWGLAKLAESARRVSCDLDADKRDKQDVQNAVKRCRERLREKNITRKQRRKLERKLEFYDEWLYTSTKNNRLYRRSRWYYTTLLRFTTRLRMSIGLSTDRLKTLR